MSLHDAVGINCENGATTENQGAGARPSVVGRGQVFELWVHVGCLRVCYLTPHDNPPLVEGESHGILLLLSLLYNKRI